MPRPGVRKASPPATTWRRFAAKTGGSQSLTPGYNPGRRFAAKTGGSQSLTPGYNLGRRFAAKSGGSQSLIPGYNLGHRFAAKSGGSQSLTLGYNLGRRFAAKTGGSQSLTPGYNLGRRFAAKKTSKLQAALWPGKQRNLGRRGFTLIEIIAASAMFAAVVGALVSIFYSAFKMREKAYQTFQMDVPSETVIGIIKGDLENCLPPVGILAGALLGTKEAEGDSRADTLEFYTASGSVNDRYPWGDVQKIDYSLEPPEDSETAQTDTWDLTRSATRNLLASTEEEPPVQRLLKGVASLEFSYYDGQQWQDSWDTTANENVLPVAIKARVDFAAPAEGARARQPIELVVPVVAKALSSDQSQQSGTGSSGTGSGSGSGGGQAG